MTLSESETDADRLLEELAGQDGGKSALQAAHKLFCAAVCSLRAALKVISSVLYCTKLYFSEVCCVVLHTSLYFTTL